MAARLDLEELAEILRKRICPDCGCRSGEQPCGPERQNECRLFQLFPLVAQAILATEGHELEPYLRAIDENVCSVCVDQALDGTCARRAVGCALDGRLREIVDAINQATRRSFLVRPQP
jgi:hypothetical protein